MPVRPRRLTLCEALSRRLGRTVTLNKDRTHSGVAPEALDWRVDTLVTLNDLGRLDVDAERRRVLGAAAYSVAALALPGESWWGRCQPVVAIELVRMSVKTSAGVR